MAPKIIGAGLGRNGTLSTQAALIKLGFTKTYHMAEIIKSPKSKELTEKWTLAYKLKFSGEIDKCKAVLFELVDDYDATVDHPACDFYKELSEMYPEALVLLNQRDNPEGYGKSVAASIGLYAAYSSTFIARFLGFFTINDDSKRGLHKHMWRREEEFQVDHQYRYSKIYKIFNPKNFTDEEFLKNYYIYWQNKVETSMKLEPKRLLKFNVKQGWTPLCQKLTYPSQMNPSQESMIPLPCRK